MVAQWTQRPRSWPWNSCLKQVLGVKHTGEWAGACLEHTPQHKWLPKGDLPNYIPSQFFHYLPIREIMFLTLKPSHNISFTCYLFLQVPDLNPLLSGHLSLQAYDICRHNIDVYLFPQASLELTPELLLSDWCWQRGEQPLTNSILCDWFQHPNPWVVGRLWIFIRDNYSTAACCESVTLPKGARVQTCPFLPCFST